MESYAIALKYAIPFFVLLVILEHVIGKLMGVSVNRSMDTISSLSSGITNTLKSLTGLTLVIVSYEWMVGRVALFHFTPSFWLYLLAFIGLDFAGYWSHRFNHEVNLFWNRHIIHHSSEEYNLSCALRQSISAIVGVYFFLYLPMAIMGVPAEVVGVVAPIHFFSQFWYHTRLIGKMGWLEKVIVTPSHHRVHHAINEEYLDKNYAEIFIIWDKLFGTFQEERADIPPVYGVKRPVHTWNPIIINFMHVWQLVKDSFRTRHWADSLRIWFMPTGWRPMDVVERFPIVEEKDIYQRKKYDTKATMSLHIWSWFQFVLTLSGLYYMLIYFSQLSYSILLWLVIFLMCTIFSYTSLMDRVRYTIVFEAIKSIVGIFLLVQLEAWYFIDVEKEVFFIVFGFYLIFSSIMTFYFTPGKEKRFGFGDVK